VYTKKERGQEELFLYCRLSDLIPEEHILKRVHKAVDFSWIREEVRESYCEYNGRPSIDPESALRLMLAGLFQGIVHDRKLMREAQVNVAIRWFAGYRLDESLPDHSSLTRIRERWGAERFRRIFERTVKSCMDAGLVGGETVHVDATLIRADVSWESVVEKHVEEVLEANETEKETAEDEGGDGSPPRRVGGAPKRKKPKKMSRTDPDATLTTSSDSFRMEPSYKQHTVVDDEAGVVLDVKVTTGEANEGKELDGQLDRVEGLTGSKISTVTADRGYSHSRNYKELEKREVDAIIPPQKRGRHGKVIPLSRFKYDGRQGIVRCPGGKILRRASRGKNGWLYRGQKSDCGSCRLRSRCVPSSGRVRSVLIVDGYEALLRARRRWKRKEPYVREQYGRHRWRVEGVHGEAKKWHGLGRAMRRGLWNVAVQAYLTAAVLNLKRLVNALGLPERFSGSFSASLARFIDWLTASVEWDRRSTDKTDFSPDRVEIVESLLPVS